MIGETLITKQTGAAGRRVSRVYVEAGCDIERELYLSLLADRATARIIVVASTEGGMEIEHVAETQPEEILRAAFRPQLRRSATALCAPACKRASSRIENGRSRSRSRASGR